MPTIFQRITHLKLSPNQEIKVAIGKEICGVYFSQKKKAKIFKIDSVEPEGTFKALSYPKKFTDVMDKIILKHCSPKVKRRRINQIVPSKPQK